MISLLCNTLDCVNMVNAPFYYYDNNIDRNRALTAGARHVRDTLLSQIKKGVSCLDKEKPQGNVIILRKSPKIFDLCQAANATPTSRKPS
jgi:hypothetical protein